MDGSYNLLNKLSVDIFQTQSSRGSSYIETPSKFKHAKCGLVKPSKQWSTVFETKLYVASSEPEKYYKVSVLNKIENQYSFKVNAFPVSYEDIDISQHDNKICVMAFEIDDEETVALSLHSDYTYILNDTV